MNELKSTVEAVENAILKLIDASESQRKDIKVSTECSDYDSSDEFSGSRSNDEVLRSAFCFGPLLALAGNNKTIEQKWEKRPEKGNAQ